MIDIHAHLCFPDFDMDREEIIRKCRKEISAVIVGTARLDEGIKALELSKKHEGFLFPTLGFHPTEGDDYKKIIELIKKNKDRIAGIGEVGLDHHWEKDMKKQETQKEIFHEFIGLAEKLRKPLVIHSWDAEEECFEEVAGVSLPVIFHCFSGSKELAMKVAEHPEFYISISTMVLFSKGIRKIAKAIPIDRLLLETDSPFLSPEKGTRNYPWNIKLSAGKIAELRGILQAEVLEKAKENAVKAFGLRI